MSVGIGNVAFIESSYTGAGVECIEHVLRRGLQPVLLTRNPSQYAFLRSSPVHVATCDTRSLSDVTKCLSDIRPLLGVGTTDEYSVHTSATVARSLSMAGPDPQAARACRNKRIMREILSSELNPRWAVVRSVASIEAAALRYPIVVKPVNLTGGALVRMCATRDEAEAHISRIRTRGESDSTPRGTEILAEEYIEGEEFSAEFMDGKLLGITRKHLFPGAGFVEAGHDFPVPPGERAQGLVAKAAESALAKLNAVWGPIHMELRCGENGVKVIEVNGRLPGDRIPRLIELSTGFSMTSSFVDRLLGGPRLGSVAAASRGAAIRMWRVATPAILSAVRGLDEVKHAPNVVTAEFAGMVGHRYNPQHSNLDRIGHLITVGTNAHEAAAHADAANRLLRLSWNG